jgi:hypothetical protein
MSDLVEEVDHEKEKKAEQVNLEKKTAMKKQKKIDSVVCVMLVIQDVQLSFGVYAMAHQEIAILVHESALLLW